MPRDRSPWRNVHFVDASNGSTLGGCYQKGSLTEETLIWILGNVLLVVEGDLVVRHQETNRTIVPSAQPVLPGTYEISASGTVHITNEPWVARIISTSISGRENAFVRGVRRRDQNCVISGEVNELAPWNDFTGLQAAHVFPLAKESLWIDNNYRRWITNIDEDSLESGINSIQNGLLMLESFHTRFDQYMFSVNPDDDYKITTFLPNSWGIDGRVLEPACRKPSGPDRVSDELLRWHFWQSVLANMRGSGEPLFETDFPSGRDQMAVLATEPYGKERLEMEVSERLKRAAHEVTSIQPVTVIFKG
ncbi:hypothetical protein L228DRAFT_267841 [Xylona heveae TC161]|uniref:Uncharacterized protein n=1 Tax=Xylona heveae (strain CBS 132557 / TC161) TaxID=1328760 RepID=A0A165HSM7_XYLHT|nr:hypothetical protein L228DRAFT_267841 [Xylona heveae TC161]KZF23884.1 hypothetical protein L228DRAFT_267841 [Xylona heveae TC161]